MLGISAMKTIKIKYKIGFADGEIQAYTKNTDGSLRVSFKTWNDKYLEISFKDTLRLLDNTMYGISDLVRIEGDSFLQEAVEMEYTKIPDDIPYKQYRFLDVCGEPSMDIIALDITIEEIEYLRNKG